MKKKTGITGYEEKGGREAIIPGTNEKLNGLQA